MRRPVLSFACLLVAGTNVFAQGREARVGLVAAMNQSRVEGQVSDVTNRSGRAFGVYSATPIKGAWSLQSGAIWTQKGWGREEPGTRDLAEVKLAYVEVPVLLRYDVAPRARVGGVLIAGPGFAFRTGCTLATTDASAGTTAEASCAEIDQLTNGAFSLSSFDVGAIGGAGVRVAAGRANVLATAQYELGLRNLESGRDSKNRAATIAIGLELPFGK
jgi:hypothetical protein